MMMQYFKRKETLKMTMKIIIIWNRNSKDWFKMKALNRYPVQ